VTKSEKIICGFISIFLSSILWPSLPQISLIAFAVFVLIIFILYKAYPLLIGMLTGLIWASLCGHYYLYWQLDPSFYQQNLILEGEVISLMSPITTNVSSEPIENHLINSAKPINEAINLKAQEHVLPRRRHLKFNFSVLKAGTERLSFSPRVRLSWFGANLAIQQGDKLKLFVKLKPATGLANPDGFDYQTWLTSKNIVGTGYVKASPSNQFLVRQPSLRQRWVNRLLGQNVSHIKWILALSFGDRRLLEKDDWALMQRTGTAHLFAISGMHLGIVFGCILLLSRGLSLGIVITMGKSLSMNIKSIMLLTPIMVCIGYALIAGFEVPVLRALFTALLWTSLIIFTRYWRTPNVLLVLLAGFFIFFPFAILGVSFWFSFFSVLIIIFYLWRFPLASNSSIMKKVVYGLKLQLFISVVTLPMIAYTFSSLPIIAFAANLFMIPIVTFVLVPLCLLGAILLSLGFELSALYSLINECFKFTFWLLRGLDDLSNEYLGCNWQQKAFVGQLISWLTHPLLLSAAVLSILPAWPRKQTILVSLICLSIFHKLNQSHVDLSDSAWTIYAMDVGQGTAIVIRDTSGTILNDTGGSFAGFSMANAVLMPFFEAKRIKELEYLLISHFDNDHAGGIHEIAGKLKVKYLLSPKNGCNREDFLRDNPSGKGRFMTFSAQVLWPVAANDGDENNQSCVIKLEKGKHSVLLTGDIEKQAEARIVALYKHTNKLKADILIAPHHGSKTSSSLEFVQAVGPKYVIFTSGNHNRWNFPAQIVLNRYQSINARILTTGKQGRIKLEINDDAILASSYRIDEHKRWYYNAR